MAAAQEERSVDATVAAVSSKPDGVFTGKEEQRAALKAFLGKKDVFTLHTTGFEKSLVKHCDETQVSRHRKPRTQSLVLDQHRAICVLNVTHKTFVQSPSTATPVQTCSVGSKSNAFGKHSICQVY